MAQTSRLITYEDSLLLPADKLSEIVKGELRTLPLPGVRHALLVERLSTMLRSGLDPDRFEVLTSSFGQLIQRDPFTYRIPDLGVYLRDSLGDDHYVSATPELLVEVMSPANRKGRIEELIEDYEHLQAPEIWLVYPEERRMRRLQLEAGRLLDSGRYSAGSLAPQCAPDAAVDLDELWAGPPTRR